MTETNGEAAWQIPTGRASGAWQNVTVTAMPADGPAVSDSVLSRIEPRQIGFSISRESLPTITSTTLVSVVVSDVLPAQAGVATVAIIDGATAVTSGAIGLSGAPSNTLWLQVPPPAVPGARIYLLTFSGNDSVTASDVPFVITWSREQQTLALDVQPPTPTGGASLGMTLTDPRGARISGTVDYSVRDMTPAANVVASGVATVDASGTARVILPTLPAGQYLATATARESATHHANNAGWPFSITQNATTTTLAPVSDAVHGTLQTFVATLSGGTDYTGVVFFSDGGTLIGLAPVVNGQATFATSLLSVGPHTIVAEYMGDAQNSASRTTASVNVLAWQSAVTAVASSTTADVGDTLTLDTTVTLSDPTAPLVAARAAVPAPTADGTVQLLVDGAPVGDPVALVAGQATLPVPTTVAGEQQISARFVPAGLTAVGSDSAASTITIAGLQQNIAVAAPANLDVDTP